METCFVYFSMSSDRVSSQPLEQMVKGLFHVCVYSFLCEQVIVYVSECVCAFA